MCKENLTETKETVPCFYKDEKGRIDYEGLADYVVKRDHVCMIDDLLRIYDNGIYRIDNWLVEKAIDRVCPDMTSGQRRKAFAEIKKIAPEKERCNSDILAFANGWIDLRDKPPRTVKPFSPDVYCVYQMAAEYNAEMQDGEEKAEEYLNQSLDTMANGDPKIKDLLIAATAYSMYPENPLHCSFALVHKTFGYSGMDMYEDILTSTLGRNLCDKKYTHTFFNCRKDSKLADLLVEVCDIYPDDKWTLKRMDLVNRITEEGGEFPAGGTGTSFANILHGKKLIFCCSDLPQGPESDICDTFMKNMVIIPMKHHYTEEHTSTWLMMHDKNVIACMARKCVEMLDRMGVTDGHFNLPTHATAADMAQRKWW